MKVTKRTKTIEELIGFTLELSVEEAAYLKELVNNNAVNGTVNLRPVDPKLTDDLWFTLTNAGVPTRFRRVPGQDRVYERQDE